MAAIKHLATGETITVAEAPTLIQGVWECGDQRFTDPSGDQFVQIPTISTSVVDFWELFTVQEEVAIRASNDPVVQVWLRRLDDPRTKEVKLSFQYVIDAITYVAGVIPFADGRLAQILAGVPA